MRIVSRARSSPFLDSDSTTTPDATAFLGISAPLKQDGGRKFSLNFSSRRGFSGFDVLLQNHRKFTQDGGRGMRRLVTLLANRSRRAKRKYRPLYD